MSSSVIQNPIAAWLENLLVITDRPENMHITIIIMLLTLTFILSTQEVYSQLRELVTRKHHLYRCCASSLT